MRQVLSVLAVVMCVIGSSTSALATPASAPTTKEKHVVLQAVEDVVRHAINPVEVWWLYLHFADKGGEFPPSYYDGKMDYMGMAYSWLFHSWPEANWLGMMEYMWWEMDWKNSSSGYEPDAIQFAQEEGVTPDNARTLWSWRQEFLRQIRVVMENPETVRELYARYKSLVVMLARADKDAAMYRLDTILALIRGTYESYDYFTILWSMEDDQRDAAYDHVRYGDNFSTQEAEAIEWYYFLERRRAVGGDQIIKVYEDIIVDLIWTVSYDNY